MNNKDLFIKIIVHSWQSQVNFFNSILNKLSDEQLMQEIAPTRNRGIYLLGHLTAVHDLMLPLLRFEEALYPELQSLFIDLPDKATKDLPSIQQLKQQWNAVNEKLLQHINTLSVDNWLARHANISEKDFTKEPHRNRLSVLLSRESHLGHHRGQIVLLVKK